MAQVMANVERTTFSKNYLVERLNYFKIVIIGFVIIDMSTVVFSVFSVILLTLLYK